MQSGNSFSAPSFGPYVWHIVRFAVILTTALLFTAQNAHTQTFQIIQNFTLGGDGAYPLDRLALDQQGNVYGISAVGRPGIGNDGAVFKLSPTGQDWTFSSLYNFARLSDGAPRSGPALGPDGKVYGTALAGPGSGCNGYGCGLVYRLSPPGPICSNSWCGWSEEVLYVFTGGVDGSQPSSNLVFDQAGNVYGATWQGGAYGSGVVYRLSFSNGGWSETVIHHFPEYGEYYDGTHPSSLLSDDSGNLYGITSDGGWSGYGTVFKLTESQNGWNEEILYTFTGGEDSGNPLDLVRDSAGNLYVVTIGAGCSPSKCPDGVGSGGVFRLSPSPLGWTCTKIYSFGNYYFNDARLSVDAAGNLYGSLARGGDLCACGEVYKLSPEGDKWVHTVLHDFNGTDGWWVYSVTADVKGHVYGTTWYGGNGYGVVFQITP